MTTTSKRIVVAVNPAASSGGARDAGSFVERALADAGHDVLGLERDSMGELEDALRGELVSPQPPPSPHLPLLLDSPATTEPPPSPPGAPASTPDAVVVVGGDGMVNLATNLLAGSSVPLGIVPTGTGNDVARALDIPLHDPASAVRMLLRCLESGPRTIDVGRIRLADGSTRLFAGALSAGFDAIVNERANVMNWPRGQARYVLAMLRELAGLRPRGYILTLDDGPSASFDALLVSVANGVSIGGGMRITPHALLDDGMFDVLVVDPLGRLRFLQIFPRVFRGTHVTDTRVHIHRASRVRLESPGIVSYADGERIGPLPQEIEIVPGALRVLAPGARASPS